MIVYQLKTACRRTSMTVLAAILMLLSGSLNADGSRRGVSHTPVSHTHVQGVIHQLGEPAASEFAEDTEFYLYNVGTGMFYTAANAWYTRACVGFEGVPVKFVKQANGIYLLSNYLPRANAWYNAFFDNEYSVWTDRRNQANYGWAIFQNNDYYRIGVAVAGDINPSLNQDNYPDCFAGIDITANIHNNELSPLLTDNAGHCIDWYLVSADDYAEYMADEATQQRRRLQQLKILCAEVDATFQYQSLLDDANATADALLQARTDTYRQLLEAGKNIILSPKFTGGYGGWQNNQVGNMPTTNFNTAESFQMNFNICQDFSALPNGYYTLKASAFCRPYETIESYNKAAETEIKTYLYANDDRVAVKSQVDGARAGVTYPGWVVTLPDGTIVPNSQDAAEAAFAQGYYDNIVTTQVTDGTLRIGIGTTEGEGTARWNCFSNFVLTYNKDNVDLTAYIEAFEEAYTAAKTALDDQTYDVVTGEERAALQQAIDDYADPEQSVDALTAATQALRQATQTFISVKAVYANLATIRANLGIDNYPYASSELRQKLSTQAATQPKNAAEALSFVQTYREIAESNALAEGVEGAENITSYMTNPDSNNDVNGWTTTRNNGSGGGIGILSNEPWTDASGNSTHNYFDGGDWANTGWDVSFTQNITLNKGTYLLSAIGRSGGATVTLFADDATTTFPSIGSSGGVFDRGWNMQFVRFEVDEQKSVTLGVRGISEGLHCWMSFSRFRLMRLEKGEEGGGDETGMAIDYEDEVIDWNSSVNGRFTPVIMSDGDNHYLSVDQDTRYNNGATLTSNSLKNAVAEGEDFVLQMDLKLGNTFNGSAPTFTVYDSADAAAILSLTGTATNSADWKINGRSTLVTLPNSGDVRYKTIADINWCSIKLVRSGALTFLSITDKESGDEIRPLGIVLGSSKTGGLGKMEFVTARYSANFAIDNVVVRPVKDGDVPELEPTTCTVHFIDEDGDKIKDDELVTTIVGIEYDADEELKADFLSADGTEKYIFISATTVETTDDATHNEVTLTFRKANKWHYVVNAVDGDGNLIKELASGERFENDEFMQPYQRFISHNDILWRTDAQRGGVADKQFRVPVSMTSDNVVVNQTYYYNGENPVFVAEAEDLPGMTPCSNNNMVIRCSNAACAYATDEVEVITLPSGAYQFLAGSSVPGSYTELILRFTNSHGDDDYDLSAEKTNLYETGGEVWSDRPLKVSFVGGHANAGFDYIAIIKTGDVDDVTKPLNINADEWALLKAAHAAMPSTDEWYNKWNTNTDEPTAEDLPNVTVVDGHIIGIDLSTNGLTGTFPFDLLKLPFLETLFLEYNNLTGDIGTGMQAFADKLPANGSLLSYLDISGNKFSGNLGLFAQSLPNLEHLDASNNCLSEVSPMISVKVTDLDIYDQTISQEVTLHPGLLTAEELSQLPNILLYNHATQAYTSNISRVYLSGQNFYWQATCGLAEGFFYVWQANEYFPFRGQNGEVVNASTDEGHSFPVKLTFDMGDGNFDGAVSVLDLQTDINYIVNDLSYSRPINFTAADLKTDDVINVLDVVKLVDLLMANVNENDSGDETASGSRRLEQSSESLATVSVAEGQLVVSSNVPVAAFDIVVSGAGSFVLAQSLKQMGFTCRSEQQQGGVRIIGYALGGATLPAGQTTLGRVAQGVVTRVTLSDKSARLIPATGEGGVTTGVDATLNDGNDRAVYRMTIGRDRAIAIDREGNKTIEKKPSTTK